MRKKAPKDKKDKRKHKPKEKPSRTEQARNVAEEYASDQREVIEKLRKPPN